MGIGKWIGGIVGFMASGPLGALAGYVIGSFLESSSEKDSAESYTREYDNSEYGQRNSFLFSLLVMASYIIQADGKIMHSEMEFVRNFLRRNFGEAAVSEGQEILLKLFERRKEMDRNDPHAFKRNIAECGEQIRISMSYEQRLQLLNFLCMIAASDGHVCDAEIAALREVSVQIGLSQQEVDSLLNLKNNTLEAAYKVLEIEPTATDSEVRAAYRRMALKHHPDKVATLGEDIKKAADEKFQEINEAKERIYKARGLK